MAKLDHLLNKNFFSSQSITTDVSSDPENLNGFSLYAIQHIWSGASGGWFIIIEGSNVQGTKTDNDYTTIDTTTVSGTSGNRMVNVEKAAYSFVRVRVDFSSGGGTLTSIINAKV